MDTRVALISIIVENNDVIDDINRFLHEAGKYIIGRMESPTGKKVSTSSALPLMRHRM